MKIWEIMDIELSDDKMGNGAMKNADRCLYRE